MATTFHRLSSSGRPLLFAMWCTLFATGCDTSQSESSSKPDQSSPTLEAVAKPQSAEPESTGPNLQTTSNQTKPASKALDLSRGTNLESLDEITDIGGIEPDNLLPDLFEDQSSKTGARASGRVLMSETEEASIQAIEGVEFKLEVPVN